MKLMRLKAIEIIPVHSPVLTDTWGTVITSHVYEADALQIATCKYSKSDALITADEKLAKTSNKLGLKTYHITKDEKDLKQQF